MVGDPVSFIGDTRYEVITVLANCGSDTDRAREALVTWISRKQAKGRSTEHILNKLRDIEAKFIKDSSLHSAFREARAETFLPRPPGIPLPEHIRRPSQSGQKPPWPSAIDVTSIGDSSGPRSSSSSAGGSPPVFAPSISPISPRSALRFEQKPDDLRRASSSTARSSSSQWWSPAPNIVHAGSPPSPKSYFMTRSPTQAAAISLPPSPEDRNFPNSQRPLSQSPTGRRIVAMMDKRSAPDFPLPPIPASDQSSGTHGRLSLKLPRAEPPSPPSPSSPVTPTYSEHHHRPTPSPVLRESDGSDITDLDSRSSLRRRWQIANPEPYLSDDIVRGDSPLQGSYGTNNGKESKSGTEPPPPYVGQKRTYTHPDHRVIGAQLDKALKVCGVTPVVRREVIRCLRSEPGYEPPYWQARLLDDCGLNSEAVEYLVHEMTGQVNWATIGKEI
ncbi:hypothetical protein BS17DRAFT_810147 [Gyrodon lividus]|nr:hypothetical protein BS17DRAFT_810147 [Gyrodon lividus]